MNIEKLEKVLENEPKFRLKQAWEAIFLNLIDDWEKASNLPNNLRKKLNEECPLEIEAKTFIAKDKKSVKALLTLSDSLKIESVLLKHGDDRNTVCVSSQAGCPVGCLFCATGQMGFKRNLTVGEIVSQVLYFARILEGDGKKVNSIVFMGMGEPFLNYDNVLDAIKIINAKDGFSIGARHISISTIGIPSGIKKIANEKLQLNLAISIHSPINKVRSNIVPINKRYPLEILIKEANNYINKTGRRVMFEYVLLKNFNDTENDALALVELLKKITKPLYFVNLILYNEVNIFKPSLPKQANAFKKVLEKNRIAVTERYRFGRDIKAACGQLALKN